MGRTEIERTVTPSLLDRLSDHQPGIAADPPVHARNPSDAIAAASSGTSKRCSTRAAR